jgi:lysophospholipase L1-like esterase
MVLAQCSGKSPMAPTPQLQVFCPANASAVAAFGDSAANVSFADPTTNGGKAPVSTTCSPASGGSFAIGTTPVSCIGTDAAGKTASCTLTVTVAAAPPRIALTNFMAFGDSMTEGKTSVAPALLFPTSYTLKLASMLQARYTDQTIVLATEGNGGEKAADGVDRFNTALATDNPQAVLLMDGANDISKLKDEGVDPAIDALSQMAFSATSRGLVVFLATLPPEKPSTDGFQSLPSLNAKIVNLAIKRHLELVDVNAAFHGDLSLISADGLHPTDAGYQVIAQTFFDRIVAKLDVVPTLPTLSRR